MAGVPIAERNQDATIYVGGLDEKVTESLLWELFVQAGPVVNVHMPKDRITGNHQGYGFVEFISEFDADYAIKIMNMIKLYGKPIRVNKASAHQKNLDVGANVFIGNLDPEVDEKLLYDTFSAFGVILQTPKIMRDPETGNSKGYAFVNFASFDASDASIEAMNGQYLCNRAITISYAFKKDAKGERHGSAAERLLAAQNPLAQVDRPHQLFADSPSVVGVASNITSSAANTANQPTVSLPPIPPIGLISPAQLPIMPPIGLPPIHNPLYYANPEDSTNMIQIMQWQQMQQNHAHSMAFNQFMPPPPPIAQNIPPPGQTNATHPQFIPPPIPGHFVPPPPPSINDTTQT